MLIGSLSINAAFFDGWDFKKFKEYFDSHNWQNATGKTSEEVAELIGIKVLKKKPEVE